MSQNNTSSKTLIIAEKPSVAADIARALGGGMKKQKDYFENDKYVVSSAVGHLLQMVAPDKFEVKRGKWSLVNLPVLPDYFDLSPIKRSHERLKVLQKLYARNDINEVINACDAGREGELIFFNLMRYLNGGKSGKAVKRLWLSSMTATAITDGFTKLRENSEMIDLQHAAECRAMADWLVGINSTRAITALHSQNCGFMLTPVGRVQTPTLALIVDREKEIKSYTSRDYWEVNAVFTAKSGNYEGKWIDDSGVKSKDKEEKIDRIFDEATAKKIVSDCTGKNGIVVETTKPQNESAPQLFDLTSLQRECNSRFHLPAKATLATAQSLYEGHKVITYPRTDSKALPTDYLETVKTTLESLKTDTEFGQFAENILKNNLLKIENKKIFDDKKVTDHFAIIPTGVPLKDTAKDAEKKVYRLILMRFLAAFYPPAKYSVTERKTTVESNVFLTKGKVLTDSGWRVVGGQTATDNQIVPVTDKEQVSVFEIKDEKKETSPPARYNEATLLSAMEGAGKRVEDEDLREAMRERGLGTPATRASIIEGLINERYIVRDNRELHPTAKAKSLLRLLLALKIGDLTLPEMTGEWEYKLRRIEKSDFNRDDFMKEITELTKRITLSAQQCGEIENIKGDFVVLQNKCPSCNGSINETHRRFSCDSCDFFLWKSLAGREFSVEEVEMILTKKETAELEGFRSKMGREFSAPILLVKEEEKWRLTFVFEKRETKDIPLDELEKMEIVGKCPKCSSNVRKAESAFVCENTSKCEFTMALKILQRETTSEEITNLLKDGRTELLSGFISKKTRRPFSAHLTMSLEDKTGKLGFEFAPRKAAAKK